MKHWLTITETIVSAIAWAAVLSIAAGLFVLVRWVFGWL